MKATVDLAQLAGPDGQVEHELQNGQGAVDGGVHGPGLLARSDELSNSVGCNLQGSVTGKGLPQVIFAADIDPSVLGLFHAFFPVGQIIMEQVGGEVFVADPLDLGA